MLEAVALDQLTLPLELEDFGFLALEFLALAAQLFALAVKAENEARALDVCKMMDSDTIQVRGLNA